MDESKSHFDMKLEEERERIIKKVRDLELEIINSRMEEKPEENISKWFLGSGYI